MRGGLGGTLDYHGTFYTTLHFFFHANRGAVALLGEFLRSLPIRYSGPTFTNFYTLATQSDVFAAGGGSASCEKILNKNFKSKLKFDLRCFSLFEKIVLLLSALP